MWFVLVMIYTGLRASELCHIEVKNIFIEDRYMIGGMKTKAGTNRKIPIH
jgi:integrase